MSGKFNFPSAKEAKALSKGAASASQKKEKKRKMTTLPNTRVVDNCAVMNSRAAEAFVAPTVTLAGTPPSTSADPSLARSSMTTSQSRLRVKGW